jgi:hypothetical protein
VKNIKSYLKAIQYYEEQNNCYSLLIDYLKEKKSTLPKLYCEGKIYLPSFMILRKIHYEYQQHSQADPELNRLFESSIHCSKLFYSKLVALVVESRSSNISFETRFEQRIQPLGQQLINLITNIKYRIKLVELKKVEKESSGFVTLTNKLSNLGKIAYSSLSNLVYKVTLLQSTHPALAKRLYYFSITSVIILFWGANFMLLGHKIPPVASAFINIVSGMAIIVAAIIIYPIGDFGKIDISGTNVVAYKYKLFFNNHANLKMLNVFITQPPGSTGQSSFSKVDF